MSAETSPPDRGCYNVIELGRKNLLQVALPDPDVEEKVINLVLASVAGQQTLVHQAFGGGVSNATVAPNGKLYLCPAFYYDEIRNIDNLLNYRFLSSSRSVGDIYGGLNIKNRELLDIDHAPICRICDAFHCHRCIWLNETLTGDANTPSHQQCVMAHIERNAYRSLQQRLSNFNGCEITIDKVDYLDPFEIITRNEKGSR